MLVFLFWVVMIIVATAIGNKKGRQGLGFLLGLLLGPLGVLLILVTSDTNRKTCPFCKEPIHKDAIKCPKCQSDLSQTGEATTAHRGDPSGAKTERTHASLDVPPTTDEIALAARPAVMRSGRSADQTQSAMQTPSTGFAPRAVTLGDSGSQRGVKIFLGIAVGILMCFLVLPIIFGERAPSSPDRIAVTNGNSGMWGLSIHICTSSGKCTEGVMRKDSPVFVSQTECEKGAQDFTNAMRYEGMVVKYVRCVRV